MKESKTREYSKTALYILVFLTIFISPVFSTSVVINSKDWKDVISGIFYAHYNGYNVYFVNSPNPAGLFNILPKTDVILIESSSSPYIPNLEAQLKTRGYDVSQVIRVKNANLELIPRDIKNFVVVEEDRAYLAIPAGAYARALNAWLLIVGDETLNDVSQILKNAEKVILIGNFKRAIYSELSKYASEEIAESSKYKLSVKIAEKFLKVKPVKQVLITEGKYIEPELLYGSSPVLLVGSNLLPDEVKNFILSNNIKTVVAIGAQLTYVGEKIREATNKKVAVFIKFGQSTPGISPTIYAISFFPLPAPKLSLSILKALYDPAQKKLLLHFKNTGNTGVFAFTTFRVLDENEKELASGGDEEPVFIGAGEEIMKSYDVFIPEISKNLSVEIYTSYGEEPENMFSYITEKGKFGPPLRIKLEVKEVNDKAKIEILEVKYDKSAKAFIIKVKNIGNVKATVVIKLKNLPIQGVETYLSSLPITLSPGEVKKIKIKAELDEEDIKEIARVKIEADYGEKIPVKYIVKELEVKYVSGAGIGYVAGVIAIIVLAAFLAIKRRTKPRKFY